MSEQLFGYYYLVCAEEFQRNHDRTYDEYINMIFQKEENPFPVTQQLQWIWSADEYVPGQDEFIDGQLVHVPLAPLPVYNPADYEGWSA